MYLFALKTLISNRGKLLTALVGVVFSLVLVNVQGGLYFGMIQKASVLIDNCDVDIWIGHRLVENVDLAHNIPQNALNRIRGLPEVEAVEPYIVGKGVATLSNGGFEDIWIIGSDPNSMLGSAWKFSEGSQADLLRPNAISVDRHDAQKLGFPKTGDVIEINGRQAKIVAKTDGILGFMTTPYFFSTLSTARRLANIPKGYCSYFLVRATPGTDVNDLADAIKKRMPDFDVYTAAEFRKISRDYWMQRTGIGISFGASTLMGLIVGLLMVAQSLYAMALDHLTEYATLKAIGAENRDVYFVVIMQAMIIAIVGSILGVVTVLLLERSWSSPLAPLEIPKELLSGAVGLVFFICLLAALLPFQRIRRIDPAVVLQG